MAKLRATKVREASLKPKDLTSAVINKISKSFYYQVLQLAKSKKQIFYPCSANSNVALRNRCLLLVEKKLFTGKYKDDPWKYIRDVNRVLYAIQNGLRSSRSMTVQTAKEMDIYMSERGYCCGSWPILKTRSVPCEGSAQTPQCIIYKEGQKYWRFNQFTYCFDCFDKNIGDTFVPLDSIGKIKKSDFVLHQFVAEKEEPMVKCSSCLRRFHEICELHHSIAAGDKTFICRQCSKDKGIPKTVLRATQLPCSPCDQHVQTFIENHFSNLPVPIIVRTLGEIRTKVEVSKQLIGHRNGAREYPCKERKLFAFMDTGEDADICIFAVYYQMFDRDCPKPNRNSIYINFMDSVQFLPNEIRSKVYNLILLGLFSHWIQLGYEYVFIWSAPPKDGSDYIFYAKPPSMKVLNDDGLWNWYCKLLKLGLDLEVVKKCSTPKEFATSKRWKSFNRIPYFEGDVCEKKMLEVVEKSEQMRKDLQAELSRIEKELGKATGINVRIKRKRKKLEMQKDLKTKELAEFDMKEKVWELMLEELDELEKEYVIVRLNSSSRGETTQDVDYDAIQLNWINCRHLFVDFFWGNMYEFSSVRRAKYSTHVMLHRIFTEIKFCVRCESFSNAEISHSNICEDCHKNTPRSETELTSWALLRQGSPSIEPEQAKTSSEVEQSQVHRIASETKKALVESTCEVTDYQHEEAVADPPRDPKWSRCLRPRVQSASQYSYRVPSKHSLSWALLGQESKSFEPEQVKPSIEVESPSQMHRVASVTKKALVESTYEVIDYQHEEVVADPPEGPKWSRCLQSRLRPRV